MVVDGLEDLVVADNDCNIGRHESGVEPDEHDVDRRWVGDSFPAQNVARAEKRIVVQRQNVGQGVDDERREPDRRDGHLGALLGEDAAVAGGVGDAQVAV